jgi:hypothetical protein
MPPAPGRSARGLGWCDVNNFAGQNNKKRKFFFFEKNKQKTFSCSVRV